MCKDSGINDCELDVAVIMPVFNEEKYINDCISSLIKQDFLKEKMEWIFVDGGSSDNTKKIIYKFKELYPYLIKIYDNPQKTVPYSMNIGIKKSSAKYIIRLDAHAKYEYDYISKCIYYLENTDAVNVGGILETRGYGFMGQTIAQMLSSRFGVGGSQFRISDQSGYVDTVPFGAFKRKIFNEVGYYDERLTRNQDNELNYRIRKNGYKIYLANDINLSYFCRSTIQGITKMAYLNGKWNIITMKLCPGSMGMRHFIPMFFVLSMLFLIPLSFATSLIAVAFFIEMLVYVFLDILFSYKQKKSIKSFVILLVLFPVFHISYGTGSLIGISKLYKY